MKGLIGIRYEFLEILVLPNVFSRLVDQPDELFFVKRVIRELCVRPTVGMVAFVLLTQFSNVLPGYVMDTSQSSQIFVASRILTMISEIKVW